MNYDNLIRSFLDIGETMLCNGAEISRVEDTLVRLCRAYAFKTVDIHAINSSIVMTVTAKNDQILTQTRRISHIGTDLSMVESCNSLSREVCKTTPDPSYIAEKLSEMKGETLYPWWFIWMGYVIGASAFAVFFGGNVWDALAAALGASVIYFGQQQMGKIHANRIVENILLTGAITVIAVAAALISPAVSRDIVIIGNIMLLIPGLAFCNGIRDMILGDTISGLLTLSDAILRALSIGLGYFLVMTIVLGGVL